MVDHTGKTFGRWTVEGFSHTDKASRETYWKLRCECGTERAVRTSGFTTGRSLSCGCLQRDSAAIRPYEALYKSLLKSARQRGVNCSLSYEHFLLYINEKVCHYCWESLSWTKQGLSRRGAKYQLDRKNNLIGYTVDNCVACCTKCNRAKSARYSYEEWYGMTAWWRRRAEKD